MTHMGFSKEYMDDLGHGIYAPTDISLFPLLYLIHVENLSDFGQVHDVVWQSWLNGDGFILKSMTKIANLTCMKLDDVVHTTILTLKNGLKGQISGIIAKLGRC